MLTTAVLKNESKPRLSLKVQVIATIAAIAGAVILPQFFHLLGAISGLGSALGETFLPMHLPIILVGLLAGPYAGAISGLFGPLLSFALSGMPGAYMLPFMMIELCVYGLVSGLLRNVNYVYSKGGCRSGSRSSPSCSGDFACGLRLRLQWHKRVGYMDEHCFRRVRHCSSVDTHSA